MEPVQRRETVHPRLPDGQGIEVKIRLSPVAPRAARYAVQARLWLSVLLQALLDVRTGAYQGSWGGFACGELGQDFPCRPKSAHIANIVLPSWRCESRPSRSDKARVVLDGRGQSEDSDEAPRDLRCARVFETRMRDTPAADATAAENSTAAAQHSSAPHSHCTVQGQDAPVLFAGDGPGAACTCGGWGLDA